MNYMNNPIKSNTNLKNLKNNDPSKIIESQYHPTSMINVSIIIKYRNINK